VRSTGLLPSLTLHTCLSLSPPALKSGIVTSRGQYAKLWNILDQYKCSSIYFIRYVAIACFALQHLN
jgi:hypothetical protein